MTNSDNAKLVHATEEAVAMAAWLAIAEIWPYGPHVVIAGLIELTGTLAHQLLQLRPQHEHALLEQVDRLRLEIAARGTPN